MLDPVVPVELQPKRLLSRYWLPLLCVLALVGYIAHWVYASAFNDQGYAPIQPIAFSHKKHAGEVGIDCRVCHHNVERGKHAGIPSPAVCMGCHKEVVPNHPEIQKLAAIIKNGSYLADAKGMIVDADDAQAAKRAVTVKEGGVVHWARVHKLPDHVYFNHQWHTEAGIDCGTCHGPVKTMTVLRQHADLSMGWCLDCHRGNEYVTKLPSSATVGLAAADRFRVGSPSYEVIRARADNERDAVAVFGHDSATAAHAADASAAGLHAKLSKLLAAVPAYRQLPPGKVMDLPPEALPESHRKFYIDQPNAYHNAPTQCSTCHQ